MNTIMDVASSKSRLEVEVLADDVLGRKVVGSFRIASCCHFLMV
jgi:hypothetical protein